jgi:hypothetical protein
MSAPHYNSRRQRSHHPSLYRTAYADNALEFHANTFTSE